MSAPHATRWPFKDPQEAFACAFDFALELIEGETLTGTPSITVAVTDGTDASPASLKAGAPVIEGGRVLQRLVGGVAGVTYSLTCIASTSEGNTLARAAILPVEVASRWNEYRRVINPTTT
jgi:hypothetical protein